MPESPFTFWQIAMLVVVVLAAGWLIRRAGAGLRAELEGKKADASLLTPEQVQAITSHGLATAEQLFMMSAKEQQLLAITAVTMQNAEQRPKTD
jgi:hypothetical protein